MKIKSQKDFYSGVLFMVVGIGFAWGATRYEIGVGSSMGPGYFPFMLGFLITVLGIIITIKALIIKNEDGDKIGPWAWKPVAYILGANFAFGILVGGLPSIKLPAAGLIAGIYILTLVASLASHAFKIRQAMILATILAAGSYLAFIVLLKSNISVWPAFISG